ncbi:MAG: DUF3427 domain-containing protein [Bifidobacteriaceae bacterium]|nr:DUF3427 domain-containing protein [Bifidobacteriaceae bacterium]
MDSQAQPYPGDDGNATDDITAGTGGSEESSSHVFDTALTHLLPGVDLADADTQTFLEDMSSGYISTSDYATGRFAPRLIANTRNDTMADVLDREISECDSFDMSVAFITKDAITTLYQPFLDAAGRNPDGKRRIITSTKSYFNTPDMFRKLMQLKHYAGVEVLIWHADDTSANRSADEPFHPKGYVFTRRTDAGHPYYDVLVGSSNLTGNALYRQKEWNLRVSSFDDGALIGQLRDDIDGQIAHSTELTEEWIEQYEREFATIERPRRAVHEAERADEESAPVEPNSMQREALASLRKLRERGEHRAIIISATGTGKTYLSAFDVKQFRPRRMLYLVHQQQILTRAMESYQRVLHCRDTDLGLLTGTSKQADRRYVFATIQTISRDDTLNSFTSDAFDYILFDEVHHAGAATYKKVLDHFSGARFTLGMTATPERTDGVNIFDLFGNNIAYEIRLQQALDADLLCPFHYFGVTEYLGSPEEHPDGTVSPASTVRIADGKRTQDTQMLNATFDFSTGRGNAGPTLDELTSRSRVNDIVSKLDEYGDPSQQVRGLVFCSRTDEAQELSRMFNGTYYQREERPYHTAAVTEETSPKERERLTKDLENGDLDYLFTVNVFNEGVDIPSLNQVVMLRNTQSSIIFTQQLGRGLRKSPYKSSVTIIDFIGNYANNYLIPIALFGKSGSRETVRKQLASHHIGASSVHFDEIAQKRVIASLDTANLSDLKKLRNDYQNIRFQLNRIPLLTDLYREDPSLPIAMANLNASGSLSPKSYLAFVRGSEKSLSPAHAESNAGDNAGADCDSRYALDDTSEWQDKAMYMASKVILPASRPHEAMILCAMCGFGLPEELGCRLDSHPACDKPDLDSINRTFTRQELMDDIAAVFPDTDLSDTQFDAAMRVLDYSVFVSQNLGSFGKKPWIIANGDGTYALSPCLRDSIATNRTFATFFRDVMHVSLLLCRDDYDELRRNGRKQEHGFLYEHQYSLWDIMHLCCWPTETSAQSMSGYLHMKNTDVMPIMVKYEASQYSDTFLGPQDMLWFSKKKRTKKSPEFQWLLAGRDRDWQQTHFVPLFVMRKTDAQGSAKRYFYVGHVAQITQCIATKLDDPNEGTVNIVQSVLHLDKPLTPDLYQHVTGRYE